MNDTRARWQTINALLEQALDQPLPRRQAFVREACGNDQALASDVLELLGHDSDEVGIRDRMVAAMESLVRDLDERASLIGMEIGPFVLTREIARGGMGQVFEARRRNADFDQTVAIKLLPGHRLKAEAGLRFAIERRILAGLQHPHIARLIDGGTLDDGLPYIVMEYVDGVAIDRYCREQALSNPDIIELILKICDAVQLAHSNLVVHRDIKPANILVDSSGAPKLLDFGIAKLLDVDGESSGQHTRTGLRLLTPAYASPEQIEGRTVTTAVDVYALGLLAYILLTDCLPYSAKPADQQSMEQQILSIPAEAPSDALFSREPDGESNRPPNWRREQRRALKGDLDTILLTALRKEPDRRYANVASFADDLRRHLENRPIQARPETLGYRLRLFVRRHPVAVPVTALALTLALGASSTMVWMLTNERDKALLAEARATATAEFASSLLSRTSAQEDGAQLMTASDFLDGARTRVDEELDDDPQIALPMHLALANAYISWNEIESARQQVDRALLLAEKLDSTEGQARALNIATTISHYQGRLPEALDYARRSEALWRVLDQPMQHAIALNDIAISLNEMGRREEAVPAFHEALKAMRLAHGGDHSEIAWLLNNLGWAQHALGQFKEARVHYEEALSMQERMRVPTFDIAMTRSNLAGLHADLGALQRAEAGWRQSLEEFISIFGEPRHAAVARGHNLLATGLLNLGRFDEALLHSDKAVAGNMELMGLEHRWTAITLIQNAMVLLEMGRLDEAATQLARADAGVLAGGEAAASDRVNIHLVQGLIALKRSDWHSAESEFLQGQALILALPSRGRAPLDRVEYGLALALAQQGDDSALALAETVVKRMIETHGPEDWRVRLLQAELTLPPFWNDSAELPIADVERVRASVADEIGPNALAVLQLAARLESARQSGSARP